MKIGGYLAPLLALVGAGAAVYAAELVPRAPARRPSGAGRGADPTFTGPLGGGAAGSDRSAAGPCRWGGIAPGWYDDPHRQARLRYYDGQNWTEQTSN